MTLLVLVVIKQTHRLSTKSSSVTYLTHPDRNWLHPQSKKLAFPVTQACRLEVFIVLM